MCVSIKHVSFIYPCVTEAILVCAQSTVNKETLVFAGQNVFRPDGIRKTNKTLSRPFFHFLSTMITRYHPRNIEKLQDAQQE